MDLISLARCHAIYNVARLSESGTPIVAAFCSFGQLYKFLRRLRRMELLFDGERKVSRGA